MTREEVKEYLRNCLSKYKEQPMDVNTMHRAVQDCNRAIHELATRHRAFLTDNHMPGFYIGGIDLVAGNNNAPEFIFVYAR